MSNQNDKAHLILACQKTVPVIDFRSREIIWRLPFDDHDDFQTEQQEIISWYRSSVNDAKPLGEGERFLLTSVAGAVVIADRKSKRLRQVAWEPGAHSAAELPGGLVVVAISTHPDTPPDAPRGRGNSLALYDPSRPGEVLWRDFVHSCHGCVWDDARARLWVLGFCELRSYAFLPGDSPRLECEALIPLPDICGHDITPVPGEDVLLVTTAEHVFEFMPADGSFRPHPELGDSKQVKSTSVHPRTGQIAWVGASTGDYMGGQIQFACPSAEPYVCPEIYKARWL